MNNRMKYKELAGKISFDALDKFFDGEVIGARTHLSFAGKSTAALEKAFTRSLISTLTFAKHKTTRLKKHGTGN